MQVSSDSFIPVIYTSPGQCGPVGRPVSGRVGETVCVVA